MFSQKIKDALKKNWGEKADSMNCYAEVKFIDPLSHWACYIFAMNPKNEDEIVCILNSERLDVCEWSMTELCVSYNSEGEHPVIDDEYRRTRACELFKKLS